MERILELEENDDITSIRSRIEYTVPLPAPGRVAGRQAVPHLLLIVPRHNKALQSLVNMKLLARMIRTRPVAIAIISDHPVVRDFAKEVGIKAFASLNSARRAGWVTPEAPVAAPDRTLPPVAPERQDQAVTGPAPGSGKAGRRQRAGKKKYVVVSGSGRFSLLQQLGLLVLLLLLGAGLILGLIMLLPEATVTLTPRAEPVEANLVVKADADVKSTDFSTLSFPARVVQVELTLYDEIATTETELAPVGLAGGSVTLINRTEIEQLIPVSTTVATSAGTPVEFLTTITTVIPPALDANVTVPVVAVEPGPSGNVAAGQINRFLNPAYNVVARVVNQQSLGGGSMEPARVVVQDDKERLAAYLRQRVHQEGYRQLQESLGEQEFVPLQSLQVIVLDITYREFAGDFSDTFGGEMQAVVRGIVVGGYNANRLALAALEAQVPLGYELDIEGLHFGAGEVLDVQERSATFRILASGMATPVIDIHQVAEDVAWLPVGEAQTMLSQRYNLASVPGVELEPDWLMERLGRLPFSPFRIQVVINNAVPLLVKGD